ncbi:hypothetical protein NPIL_263821 [Nephila pilipes]|uniref:Uncharacterized protein n=1 Tax=Nephila pilipes TaxID=299642 RepID=A0A8X6MHV4_NEPPI|nr:hypothetical protein NPIL_263821 [Nephila pilipes]
MGRKYRANMWSYISLYVYLSVRIDIYNQTVKKWNYVFRQPHGHQGSTRGGTFFGVGEKILREKKKKKVRECSAGKSDSNVLISAPPPPLQVVPSPFLLPDLISPQDVVRIF